VPGVGGVAWRPPWRSADGDGWCLLWRRGDDGVFIFIKRTWQLPLRDSCDGVVYLEDRVKALDRHAWQQNRAYSIK